MNTIYFLNSNQKRQLLEKPDEIWKFINSSKLKPYYLEDKKAQINLESIVCHSMDQIHVIVKTDQTTLMNRDRAYQHGDGFHFVLAQPKVNQERTGEFYVIGVSPLDNGWMKKFVWYRNIELGMTPLEKTEVNTITLRDATYIIVNIPFDEIEPIKGLIDKGIGFNISYVQALTEGKNVYILKDDHLIQSEQSLREYSLFRFEEPRSINDVFYHAKLNTMHSTYKNNPYLNLGIYCEKSRDIEIKVGTKRVGILKQIRELHKGLNHLSIQLDVSRLKLGKHVFTVQALVGEENIDSCELEFYLYKENSFTILEDEINKLSDKKDKYRKESILTLRFYYQNLIEKLKQLKPYETFDRVIEMKNKLETNITQIRSEQHLFLKGVPIRLGFLSKSDQTLQPYTLYIPKSIKFKINPKLLVLLHGSGSDDTSIQNNKFHFKLAEENNTIILAPYARGTSHFYCPKEARNEVIQLTKKIAQLFSIRENMILLGGFSMGGYGVYRIFDDAPTLYKGLVIVSGHPSIGKYFKGIDYATEENIKKFSNIPLIIFHGTEDRNCKFEEVKQFCDKLSLINKECQVVFKNGVGHSGITDDWYVQLLKWLNQF